MLLELLEKTGVLVHVTTHNHTYNPANGRDRRSLLEDAVDDEYESHKTSLRTRRAAAASAADGRPSGRTPFGYRRRYHLVTRKLVAQEPDPETAPLVRELFERVQAGRSLRSIERDWDARGILNGSGRPFSSQHLRSLLLTRAYVGDRVHTPGAASGNGGVHLLSMIAACDVCDSPLAVTLRKDPTGQYTCQAAGHVRISKPDLDKLAEAAMLKVLAKPNEYRKILAAETNDAAVAEARHDVADIEAELNDLADQVGSGSLSATLAARAEPGILARLEAARKREQDLQTPSRLRGLIKPGPGVRGRWEAAPRSTRREVARLLLAPEMIGELRIARRPRDAGPHTSQSKTVSCGRSPELSVELGPRPAKHCAGCGKRSTNKLGLKVTRVVSVVRASRQGPT